jgi:hypothetical protein
MDLAFVVHRAFTAERDHPCSVQLAACCVTTQASTRFPLDRSESP